VNAEALKPFCVHLNSTRQLRRSRLQIGGAYDNRAVVFESALHDQFGRCFLDACAIRAESRQRIVVVSAEMISQRLERNAAVDAFLVNDRPEPDDFASVRFVPFVSRRNRSCSLSSLAPPSDGAKTPPP
jgi:hypothetical protein